MVLLFGVQKVENSFKTIHSLDETLRYYVPYKIIEPTKKFFF